MFKKKQHIAWSPHSPDFFVVGGQDLRFYSLSYKHQSTLLRRQAGQQATSTRQVDIEPGDGSSGHAGDQKWITLKMVNSELPQSRCLCWSPPGYSPSCLAVGQSSGRVSLTTFKGVNQVTKQFVPRNHRACFVVTWNKHFTNQLAAGLDRVRGDYSIVIWDVTQQGGVEPSTYATPIVERDTDSISAVNEFDSFKSAQSSRRSSRHSSNSTIAKPPQLIPKRETPSATAADVFDIKPREADETVRTPLHELCIGQSTVALSWLPDMPSCIAAGTGAKWLRIFDVRDGAATKSVVAHEKAVMGVEFDPFHDKRLATFSDDGLVKMWDLRRLVEPTHTLNIGSKQLHTVSWCPTRSGIIATAAKDDACIRLWDLKERVALPRGAPTEGVGTFVSATATTKLTPRVVSTREAVSAFCWHNTSDDLMLAASEQATVQLITLSKPVPLAFAPNGVLAFLHDRSVVMAPTTAAEMKMHVVADDNDISLDLEHIRQTGGALNADVAVAMRARALLGYGMDAVNNANIVAEWQDHPKLRALWAWMNACVEADQSRVILPENADDDAKDAVNDRAVSRDAARGDKNTTADAARRVKRCYMGILSLLYDADVDDDDTATPQEPEDFAIAPLFTVRASPQRQRCLNHCGWRTASSLDDTLRDIESDGDYERAAALAVFYMDLKKAIQILYRAQTARTRLLDSSLNADDQATAAALQSTSPVNLKLVAMALSGYEGGVLWKQTCRSLTNQITNPYLQACFAFLCADKRERQFSSVLSCDIALRDKIGFAMRYLDDSELYKFIERHTATAVRRGDLDGVLLTGLSNNRAVDLLENYVNRTADVQTACIAISHVVPLVFEDRRVYRWVENYRDLLDIWEMHYERATFDTMRVPFPEQKTPPQIFARCSSCGQSLTVGATTGKAAPRLRGVGGGYHGGGRSARQRRSAQQRLRCCPGCRKPLPRCSVCLLALDAALPGTQRRVPGVSVAGKGWASADVALDEWFTWCQRCKHGGHAGHLMAWFEAHERCPVSECACTCADIDRV